MDGVPVEERPLAFLGGVEFLTPRGIDNAKDWNSLTHQGNADTAVLVPAGIVGRPVNGVNDPDLFVSGDIVEVLLFTEEADLGESGAKLLGKEVLDGEVGGGNDIFPCSLVVYFEPAGPVHKMGRVADDFRD